MYDSFLKKNRDHGVVSSNHVVADVMMGRLLTCNVSWLSLDYVLFPIYVKSEKHWLLGILLFKERALHVYNTLSCDRKDHVALVATEPYRFLLPSYMAAIGFYRRGDINFFDKPYFGKSHHSSLEVIMDCDVTSSSPM